MDDDDDWSILPNCNSNGPPSDTESVASARNLNRILSSDEEPMPLPLEVGIPNAHLPDVLDVFVGDIGVFRGVIPCDFATEARQWHNWQIFLAHCPLRFVRKNPRKLHTTTPNCEGMFVLKFPSGRP